MQTPNHSQRPDRTDRGREAALQRYVEAFDRGDLDALADVVDEAIEDPEVDRKIVSINAALHAEAGLQPLGDQAALVRKLLFKHLPSAIPQPEEAPQPLTVGEVAAKIEADQALRKSLSAADRFAARQLMSSTLAVPTPVTGVTVERLAQLLKADASAALWEAFRQAALVLGIGRQQQTVQLAAARKQGRARRAPRWGRRPSPPPADPPGGKHQEPHP